MSKSVRPLSATVQVSSNGTAARDLSPCERHLARYELADACALAVAEKSDISNGHRSMIYAHFVSLMQRDGEAMCQHFASVLSGMCGGLPIQPNPDPYVPEQDDPTDWGAIAIR